MNRKPHVAEVILAELMTASAPLTRTFLEARCKKECPNSSPVFLSHYVAQALIACEQAGLILRSNWGWEHTWNMTDEGRALLSTRPPYDCFRAIRDELRASGHLTFDELRVACRRQACDYTPEQFASALYFLVREGDVTDVTDPDENAAPWAHAYEWSV